jgi:hypothetical protein
MLVRRALHKKPDQYFILKKIQGYARCAWPFLHPDKNHFKL